MLYQNILNEKEKLSTSKACSNLEVSRNAYNNWLKKPSQETESILPIIHEIAIEFQRYGYRRITKQLQRQGFKINHKKVLRLTRENKLLVKRKKPFKPQTTQSNHNLRTYHNIIKNIAIVKLNQVWVSDITYIRLSNGFAYLAIILDLFSRKCIGWQLSKNINTQLCLDALNMAIKNRKIISLKNIIHHSDQGTQYASKEYTTRLMEEGMLISMSKKATPTDNAFAESFMKTIKHEEVNMNEYQDFNDAHNNIKPFIEEVYNKKRLHSSIGYKPPNEYEKELLLKEVVC